MKNEITDKNHKLPTNGRKYWSLSVYVKCSGSHQGSVSRDTDAASKSLTFHTANRWQPLNETLL